MLRPATVTSAALFAATLLSSGCYSYTAVPLELAPEGEDVRVLVTRRGAFELSEITAVQGEIPSVRGRIVSKEQGEILLRVPVAQRTDGFHMVSLDQTVRVPTGEILQVERRDFDRGKTALLGAGALAGSAFIIISIMDAFGGDAGSGEGPDPEETRIPVPLISIPIGR
ncbi:MAG: hypothetical protein WD995_08160 [Gemmatimonadota bacterium]